MLYRTYVNLSNLYLCYIELMLTYRTESSICSRDFSGIYEAQESDVFQKHKEISYDLEQLYDHCADRPNRIYIIFLAFQHIFSMLGLLMTWF